MKIYAQVLLVDKYSSSPLEGSVASGNISLDGSSSLRRSLSLTLNLQEFNYKIVDLLRKQIKVLIGTQDETESEITWYNMGCYILTDLSLNQGTNSLTISITAKDYMVKLNGTCGGLFPAITTLHEDANYNPVLVLDIIESIVKEFSEINRGKILVSDVDEQIKQVLQYRGDKPGYFILDKFGAYTGDFYIPLNTPNRTYLSEPFTYGRNVGYKMVDFTYPSELIANAGDSVASILEKIKNTLGDNYEYFFDIHGNFIFQEIKNYLNTSQTTLLLNSTLDVNTEYYESKSTFDFTDDIITQITYTPDIANLKNDFIIWGTNSSDVDICYHLTLDNRPELPDGYKHDWREYLYELCQLDDSDYNYYKAEMQAYWRTVYDPYLFYGRIGDGDWVETNNNDLSVWDELKPNENAQAFKVAWDESVDTISYGQWTGWNPDVILAPSNLIYWLDFIEVNNDFQPFTVSQLGRRSYIKKESSVNTLYNIDIPDVCFINSDNYGEVDFADAIEEFVNDGQKYCVINSTSANYFNEGNLGTAASDLVRDLLYQYTILQNQVSVSHIPVYTLEPNTVVKINSNLNKDFNGYYVLKSTSIPLQYNGLMSTTLSKLMERI